MTIALDHFAVGTATLTDGWDLFGGLLGGSWAYGGDSAGYWWGQVRFASGPKVELPSPDASPEAQSIGLTLGRSSNTPCR